MSNNPKEPLIIAEQGSFAIGGSTLKHDGVFRTDHFLEPEGQVAYGDHAYAFYQVPVNARPYPLISSTAVLSANGHGKRRLMAAKAFRPFFAQGLHDGPHRPAPHGRSRSCLKSG